MEGVGGAQGKKSSHRHGYRDRGMTATALIILASGATEADARWDGGGGPMVINHSLLSRVTSCARGALAGGRDVLQ